MPAPLTDIITPEQTAFYQRHRQTLINRYLQFSSLCIDPDRIRDLFAPIGYNRTNVQAFQGVCKKLTADIFYEALQRNKNTGKKMIFAAGLPATGKSTHLRLLVSADLVYDGTVNNEEKFIAFVQAALDAGYPVEVFLYLALPARTFKSNLKRGDQEGRYVPVSQYKKVAQSLNRRPALLKERFEGRVKLRIFEHTDFKGSLTEFYPININRNEFEQIIRRHQFRGGATPDGLLG